jgi:hypothetical protein
MKPDEVLFEGASKNEGPIKRSIVWIDGSGRAIVTCRKDSSGLVTQVRESLEELQKSQATRFQDLGFFPSFYTRITDQGVRALLIGDQATRRVAYFTYLLPSETAL